MDMQFDKKIAEENRIKIEAWGKGVEKFFGCPYCGNPLTIEYNACCHEAGHGTDLYYFIESGDEATEEDYKASEAFIKTLPSPRIK